MVPCGEAIRSVVAGAALLAEPWESGVAYNPLSARTVQDPYPVYAALRARDPVHRSRVLKAWVFTRHADVDAILRDHRRFGNDPREGTLSSRQLAMLPPPHEYTLLLLDPPDHTRLRAPVSKAFTPRAVNALEARIRRILGALLDDIDDPAACDLMAAVACPLPCDWSRPSAATVCMSSTPPASLERSCGQRRLRATTIIAIDTHGAKRPSGNSRRIIRTFAEKFPKPDHKKSATRRGRHTP